MLEIIDDAVQEDRAVSTRAAFIGRFFIDGNAPRLALGHYQDLVMAEGEPWRIAVNVKSTDKGGPGADRSILLYRIVDDFQHPILQIVEKFKEGFSPVAAGLKNGGLDYVRGRLFDPKDMRLLPPDVPGDGNDLNDLIDEQVERAKDDPSAIIFVWAALGSRE